MGKSKRRFTQYALNVPAAMRGHLPNLNLYSVEHRSLTETNLTADVICIQQRNQKTILRLQSALTLRRQHLISIVA